MRRLSIFGIVSLMASLVTVVGTSGTAWASGGASTTSVCGSQRSRTFCSPASSKYGETVSFRVDVFDSSNSCALFDDCDEPTGTVEFYDNGALTPFTVCVLEGTGYNDFSGCTGLYSGLTVGRHDVFTKYVPAGAHPFDESSDTSRAYLVDVQPTRTVLGWDSVISAYGQPVQFTATVVPNEAPITGFGASLPSGLVQFFDNGNLLTTVGLNSAARTATYTTSTLAVGDHPNLTARYISDGNYGSSDSSPIVHSVTAASTTGTLVASATSPTYGQPVTLTDTVAPVPPGAGTPTGTVTFTDLTLANFSSQPLDLQNPDRAAITDPLLAPGPHTIRAAYGGDTNFGRNSSNEVTVTVSKANTTTAVYSSLNPAGFGQSLMIQAGVQQVGAGVGIPSGTVQFRDGTANLGAPRPIIAGIATLFTSSLAGGTHTISAVYSGDDNFNGSSSGPLTQTVTCDHTITGSTRSVAVSPIGSTCISGATIKGNLTVPAGANLSLVGATIGGALNIRGAGSVTVCGTTTGNVSVSGATGFVLLGDPDDDACATNTFRGRVTLSDNHGGVELAGNQIRGALSVSGTTGAGPFPDDAGAEIEANAIGGTLKCSANSPVATNDHRHNTAQGNRSGECASPLF